MLFSPVPCAQLFAITGFVPLAQHSMNSYLVPLHHHFHNRLWPGFGTDTGQGWSTFWQLNTAAGCHAG